MDRQCQEGGTRDFIFPAKNPGTIRTYPPPPFAVTCPESPEAKPRPRESAPSKIAIFEKKELSSLNSIYLLDSPSFIGSKTFQ